MFADGEADDVRALGLAEAADSSLVLELYATCDGTNQKLLFS